MEIIGKENEAYNFEAPKFPESDEILDKSYDTHDLSLSQTDPIIFDLIKSEKDRQLKSINLIPSENFVSRAILESLGSILTNKYSEGYPRARYYGGNQYIDQIEEICQERLLKAFKLDKDEWGCNVQPYSGSPCNLAALSAILEVGDKFMGLDLPCGGHLTHGFQTKTKKISATAKFFTSQSYYTDSNGLIDFEGLRESALQFRPKLIIAGFTAYPRDVEWKKFKEICDECGSLLMGDISHINGLIATELINSPFPYCDLVTSTTHKLLRGPRSAFAIINKKKNPLLFKKFNESLFPGLQGGPHNNNIAAMAIQFRELASDRYKDYAKRVVKNAKSFAKSLQNKGFELVSGGTDTHLILIDLKPNKISGSAMQFICEYVSISVNKNTVPGDASPLNPSGLRLGTPAMTSRFANENEFDNIAEFLYRAMKFGKQVSEKLHEKKLDKIITKDIFFEECKNISGLKELKNEVELWSCKFFLPGWKSL